MTASQSARGPKPALMIGTAIGMMMGGVGLPLALARPNRPLQIPNGTINSCDNCHVWPGGPRNPFGHEIEEHFLIVGVVQWGPALAALDSDGDGISNGQELQDPQGAWRQNDPAPGVPAAVTNPGVPTPAAAAVPAVSLFGLVGFAGTLAAVGLRVARRRRQQ